MRYNLPGLVFLYLLLHMRSATIVAIAMSFLALGGQALASIVPVCNCPMQSSASPMHAGSCATQGHHADSGKQPLPRHSDPCPLCAAAGLCNGLPVVAASSPQILRGSVFIVHVAPRSEAMPPSPTLEEFLRPPIAL